MNNKPSFLKTNMCPSENINKISDMNFRLSGLSAVIADTENALKNYNLYQMQEIEEFDAHLETLIKWRVKHLNKSTTPKFYSSGENV